MPTYRLDLAYDGTRFHGYARQPSVRTIQGELERVLAPVLGEAFETAVAGRTDRGVHAEAQVVSVVTAAVVDPIRLQRTVNRRLGPEVVVRRAGLVADDFHARHSATGRAYRYRILARDVPDPFRAAYTWHVPSGLDAAAMDVAARFFVGEHDFASFCRRSGDAPTVRRVWWSRWRRRDDELEYAVGATAFCHQMVRSIVALCVEVGRGRVAVEAVEGTLAARDRAAARGAAPPHGLFLVGVGYPGQSLGPPDW